MNSHLDFDIDLAKDQSDNNPVFYLQYAYARICNIIKHGDDKGSTLRNTLTRNCSRKKNEVEINETHVKLSRGHAQRFRDT